MSPSLDTARVIVSVGSLLLIFSATQAIARPPQHNHSPPQLSPLVRSRQLTTTTTTTTTATLAAQPIQLDESSWHRVLEGEWLLLATAFGCQSCKRLEPEWRQLAELAADHEHWHLGLRVGSLDFTSNAAMSARFQVRQLPTLFHAKDGVFRLYTGPRDHQSLMRFVQEQSWKMVEPMALSFLPRASSSPYAPNKAANKQQVGAATATATGVSMGQPFETQTTGSQMMRPMQHNSQYQQYLSGQQQQQASMNPYTNASHMLLLDLRQQLIDRGVKFNDHFRGLLSESKRSLNNMFEDTYGMMYLQNTEIFTNMYDSLEQYYATGEVELTKSMENFFERLYQKIFQVINLNRVFSQQYLKCATQQLAELRPFRDAPDKLIADIRHALVAARTLSWALNAGIDIIKSVISLGQPPQCTSMINERLLKANPLSSTTSARTADQSPAAASKVPCLGYCEQVIARCVGRANLDPLNERWRAYVVALAELGKKLTSQYNIITIIGPIDVQISEAIMNFQENSKNITEQVFQACGDVSINKQTMLLGGSSVGAPMAPSMSAGGSQSRPVLNRLGKRAAPAAPAVSSSPYFDAPMHSNQQRRGHQPMQHLQPSTHRGQSLSPAHGRAATSQLAFASGLYGSQLDPLALGGATGASIDEIDPANLPLIQMRKKSPLIIGDIRDYILSTKNFWSQLPNSICTSAILAINANFTSGGSSPSAYNSQNSNYLRRNVIASTQANCFQEPLTQGTSDLHPQQNTQDLRFRDETQKQVARLELVHSKIMDALRGVEIDWSTQAVSPTQQQQQQPPRQPSSTAVQPGEAGATSGSPDDDDLDNPDEDQIEPGSGDDMDDADGHDLTEDNDHEPTTSEPTEPDECAEDDDPLCLPGESTTPTPPDGPDANGSHHEEGAGGPAVEGTTVVPPSISVNGDIGDPLTNGKPSINTDLIGTNDLISAVDQSAQKSSAGHGSAVHQLFVIQSSFSSIVQMLFSQCVLMVLALSVVTHNNQHHHLRPMHHNH